MTKVLVINSGSSSLKMQIVDTDGETLATSLSERIGDSGSVVHVQAGDDGERRERQVDLANHGEALEVVLELVAELGVHPKDVGVSIVGHRVVHGGSKFTQPTLVDSAVEDEIERLAELAPLHNPANLRGIRVAREMFPELPHVAVFDTGFFSSSDHPRRIAVCGREGRGCADGAARDPRRGRVELRPAVGGVAAGRCSGAQSHPESRMLANWTA